MRSNEYFVVLKKIFNFFYLNRIELFCLLFILAAITRIVFIKMFGGFSVFSCSDTSAYVMRAESLLSGKIVSFSTFGYTCYLAIIFKIFGCQNLFAVHLVNIFISSLTVLTVFFAGKEFYNKNVGILAAFICIFHVRLLLWTGYILTETPFALFLSLAVLYFFKFSNAKQPRDLLFSFIFLFLTGLMRDVGFLLFIPAGAWVLFLYSKQRLIKILLVLLPTAFLFSVPWVITNKLSPAYVASVPWQNGTIDVEILKGLLWNESGRGESNDLLLSKVAQYEKNPHEYAKLMLRKLKSYWRIFIPEASCKHRIINSFFFIPFYLLTALGLVFCRPVCRKTSLLVAFILVFTLASMIGIVDFDLRYRLPADLLMIFLSAYGGVILFEKLKNKYVK